MSNARDKANIPALNFSSTGIDDNATSTAITIDSSQNVDVAGNIKFTDNGRAVFGAGSDLQIWHTGSHSYIMDSGTGNLYLQGSSNILFQNPNNKTLMSIADNNDISFYEATGTTPKFFWDASVERLELGTSSGMSPTATLVVNEASDGTPAIEVVPTTDNTNGVTANIRLWGTTYGAVNRHSEIKNITDGSTANNELGLFTNGSERMRIDSSGNVGIGETAPLGKLHVKSADSGGTPNTQYDELVLEQNGNNCGMTILCNSPGDGAIYFGDSADNDIGGIAYSHFDNKMFFKVNGSERMRIDSSGQVGIGTTSPIRNLVLATSSGDTTFRIETASQNNDVLTLRNGDGRLDFANTNMTILSNGKVGIGTSSPAQKLDVNGTVKATAFEGDGSALTGVGGGILTAFNGEEDYASTTSSTNTSYIDVGSDIVITPTATSDKVWVNVRFEGSIGGGNGNYKIVRTIGATSTDIFSWSISPSTTRTYDKWYQDSPSTTSAITYKLQMQSVNGGAGHTIYIADDGFVRWMCLATTV